MSGRAEKVEKGDTSNSSSVSVERNWSNARFDDDDNKQHHQVQTSCSTTGDGSASPSNLPVKINPPKPTRVVVGSDSGSFASPQISKRKLNSDNDGVSMHPRTRRMLESGYVLEDEEEDEEGKLSKKRISSSEKKKVGHISDLLDEIMLEIFSYLIGVEGFFSGPWAVCKAWRRFCNKKELWRKTPSFDKTGDINTVAFRFLGLKNQGTEGMCFKVYHRKSGILYAMKKARVYPTGEGVPYYMLRELAFLQGLEHPNIACVERISLVENRLYLFFPYIEKSLFDLINPNNDANGGLPLPPKLVKRFLYQILKGVAFCHERGVLHRNLKPKHLLVEIPDIVHSPHRCVNVNEEKKMLGRILDLSEDSPEYQNIIAKDSSYELPVSSSCEKNETEEEKRKKERRMSTPTLESNGLLKPQASTHPRGISAFTKRNPHVTRSSSSSSSRRASQQKHDDTIEEEEDEEDSDDTCSSDEDDDEDEGESKIKKMKETTKDKKKRKKKKKMKDKTPQTNINKAVYARLLEAAEQGIIQISDFALVRSTSIPLRSYTTEVVTLWYRSPEVLMGGQYFAAVDVWSIGCVFAEMILGKPLFPGICEIDQLFQIFLKLGTPDEETWKEFSKLPNYRFEFPNWKRRSLKVHVPRLCDDGLDLMSKMLNVNPDRRITATQALHHKYFDDVRTQIDVETSVENKKIPKTTAAAYGINKDIDKKVETSKMIEVIKKNRTEFTKLKGPTPKITCWQYSKRIHNMLSPNSGVRVKPGLDDPAYLIRYYHYLKDLESQMYPIADTIKGGLQGILNEDNNNNNNNGSGNNSPVNIGNMNNNNNNSNGDSQSDLLPVHRSMLVDWLVEVIDVFEMSVRSVFMAVNYTDRYLALKNVERRRFQLLGATCLHIASKCEDVSYIGVEDLVVCADKVYKPEHVLQLEEKVLNTLDFRMCVPTVIDFLNVFLVRLCFNENEDADCLTFTETGDDANVQQMNVDEKTRTFAQYLAELSLQEQFFISKLPSMVAAAALVLALYYQDVQICETRLLALTGYSLMEIKSCVERLRVAHGDAPFMSSLNVILRRYQRNTMHRVAEVQAKPDLSGLYGTAIPASIISSAPPPTTTSSSSSSSSTV